MESNTMDYSMYLINEPVRSVLQERSINKFPSVAIFHNTISIYRATGSDPEQ
jgi:hypothetical protein